jgi:release factor glutamine methyltransferase
MNIRDVFSPSIARGLPRNELRLLLSHTLARDHAWLVAHDDAALSDESFAQLESLISRRARGEPIAYLVGERDFYGRRFRCSPAALIPRPETELLIDLAMPIAAQLNATRILDVGTGTGCIAITLALECANANVTALDVSCDALILARENAGALGATNIEFFESDWFAALRADAKFDLIVSNPPYIPPNDPHLAQGDLRFEPKLALQDAIDGLQSYRVLLKGAKQYLREGGALIVEHGYDQGESVPALFREAGFIDVEMIRDLAGQARLTKAILFR